VSSFKPKADTVTAIKMGEEYVYELPDGTTGKVDAGLFETFFEDATQIAPATEGNSPDDVLLGKLVRALLAAVIEEPGRTTTAYATSGKVDAASKNLSRAATSLIDKGLVIDDGKQRHRSLFPTQDGRALAKLKGIA
jgi:hypothetical protein